MITGLAVGLVTSAYPPARTDLERVTELARSFREQPTPELARAAQLSVASAISANERLQYRLHPWTSFVIVPLFALANTGIHLDGQLLGDAATSPITLGILFGYVVGKPVGIVAATWLAARLGRMRRALSWPTIAGGGAVAGIGFTVSLLISSLAFDGQQLEEAKLGVFGAADRVVAAGLGRVPADRAAPRTGARAPARRHAQRSSSTSPTTSTPSATTSAARTMRRSRWSSTATTSARTAGRRRSSSASCSTRSATSCATSGATCR